MRVFLDLGSPGYQLLARSAANVPFAGNYVHDLLTAFRQERRARESRVTAAAAVPAATAQTLADPLTEREIEVLQLLGEGLSNKEIGERLVVAPSTVKQHLKHIYNKLDVHSRTQAVARGRELMLL